jgi:hypothetical protein
MDEFRAILKAREFVRKLNPTAIPADVHAYATHIGAVIRSQTNLEASEPGWSFESKGKHYICVNGNDRPERQRFTICHELAHIALELPSTHSQSPWSGSFIRKSPEEIICDVFAAELLLPYHLFGPATSAAQISFAAIEKLADDFVASLMAAGSRFATVLNAPCAFVLSEQGKVRYTSRSTSLRDANGWITPQSHLPQSSVSAKLRGGETSDGSDEIEADLWFENWQRGGTLREEARHLSKWDQTLTLLWFEDEEVPALRTNTERNDDEDDDLLRELDGNLPWPGKKRRK